MNALGMNPLVMAVFYILFRVPVVNRTRWLYRQFVRTWPSDGLYEVATGFFVSGWGEENELLASTVMEEMKRRGIE